MIRNDEWAQTGFNDDELDMLKDAYVAITRTDMWSWFADYVPEQGFALSTHPNMDKIDKAMHYEGHSGFSYAWTMRQMQIIAKNGWEVYLMLCKRNLKNEESSSDVSEI